MCMIYDRLSLASFDRFLWREHGLTSFLISCSLLGASYKSQNQAATSKLTMKDPSSRAIEFRDLYNVHCQIGPFIMHLSSSVSGAPAQVNLRETEDPFRLGSYQV
ncbi:hypothetical protein ARMSODRAFT_170962 [Armillaria solidipes]|uniref:Uncharacterized protein n=1 Tax=Armillaria solidipes TaxID=1076256 RepID=A0A2H3BDQ2_9AGAR|nr:hypothetical protein ARMSODRAFT_170962 [Armillaria solidipes]